MKIAAGTAFYMLLEIMKETAVDDTGKTKWHRPFFNSALLFFGMSFTLLPYFWFRFGKPGIHELNMQVIKNMLLPSLLEFIGQVLFMIGSLYIPMALSLALKGSRVIFSAFLLVLFLKRKLFAFHWIGVTLTIVGLAVASTKHVLRPKGNSKTVGEVLTGIALILAGECIRSFRTVLEEKLMKKLRYDALMVVGLQGIMALILTIPALFVVNAITLSSGKPMEDLSVTMAQFSYTPLIYALAATFPISVPGLFIAGAYVTKLMSAVHNALTTMITLGVVWGLSTIIHQIDSSRGTPLEVLSIVELTGYSIVLVASLVYDSIIRLPKFYYPLDRAAASGAGSSEKSMLGITESTDNLSEETVDKEDRAVSTVVSVSQ
jgi:drug/metabolite transporter (DMT)-like permease